MIDNEVSKTLQFQFWRATVPVNATPAKERVKCDVQQETQTVFLGEAFIDPHLQMFVCEELEDGGGLYNILYTYRPFF